MPAGSFIRGTWPYYRRIALPAICLLLVAGVHFVRVEFYGQTAWKGGGFGMFSTIDSPAARYLRIYLVNGESRIPVREPVRLTKRVSEYRSAPNTHSLEVIAEELAAATWVRSDYRTFEATEAESSEPEKIRALRINEALPPVEARFFPETIEVEFWRYQYEPEGNVLRGRLIEAIQQPVKAGANFHG